MALAIFSLTCPHTWSARCLTALPSPPPQGARHPFLQLGDWEIPDQIQITNLHHESHEWDCFSINLNFWPASSCSHLHSSCLSGRPVNRTQDHKLRDCQKYTRIYNQTWPDCFRMIWPPVEDKNTISAQQSYSYHSEYCWRCYDFSSMFTYGLHFSLFLNEFESKAFINFSLNLWQTESISLYNQHGLNDFCPSKCHHQFSRFKYNSLVHENRKCNITVSVLPVCCSTPHSSTCAPSTKFLCCWSHEDSVLWTCSVQHPH